MKKKFNKLSLYRSLTEILEKRQKGKANRTTIALIDRLYKILNKQEPDYNLLFDKIKSEIGETSKPEETKIIFSPIKQTNVKKIILKTSVAATIAIAVLFTILNYNNQLSVLLKGHRPNANPEIVAKISKVYDRNKAILIVNDSITVGLKHDSAVFAPISKVSLNLKIKQQEKNKLETEKITVNTIVVPKGGEFSVTLPDGSKAFLNSNSKLTFPGKFEQDKRVVHLEGEAMFEVTKSGTPFSVICGNSITTVLGTVFNIKNKKDKDEVTLCSGSVKVSNISQSSSRIIAPDEQALISGTEINVEKVDTREILAWTEGKYYFRNIPFEEIAEKLYDWYNIDFEFANDKIKSVPFTGMINRNSSLKTIFELFEMSYNFNFTVSDSSVIINNKYNYKP